MIIIDYSAIGLAAVLSQRNTEVTEDLIRHMVLNSIRMYRTKFKGKYGEIVLAVDGIKNWRKKYYPEYKAARKKNRDASDLDFDMIFSALNNIRDEIRDNFPYKVVHVEECEADDVIAHLIIGNQEFGEYEENVIVSADHDFKQLQVYNNVTQFSTRTKKFIKEDDPKGYLLEHTLKGDAGDGVPNVLSDDRVFVESRRQTPLVASAKKKLAKDLMSMGEDVYRNYQRNSQMVNLHEQPQYIIELIEEAIKVETDRPVNKGKVFGYLNEKKCRFLMQYVQEFV